jgi:hypothetical protein
MKKLFGLSSLGERCVTSLSGWVMFKGADSLFGLTRRVAVVGVLASCMNAQAVIIEYANDKSGFDAAVLSVGIGTNVLDFEGMAVGDVLTNEFSAVAEGPVFAHLPGTESLTAQSDIYNSNSCCGSARAIRVGYSTSSDSFEVVFSAPVRALGAYFIDHRSDAPLNVSLFDDVGNVIGTGLQAPGGGEDGDTARWWGVVNDTATISRMLVVPTHPSEAFGFDDFTYGAVRTSVPEPSTLGILALGILGAGFARLRKH